MRTLIAALALGASAPLQASVATLAAPSEPFLAGGLAKVELVILNPSDRVAFYHLPTQLDARLRRDSRLWHVSVEGGSGDVTVPAGGFTRLPLSFLLPPDASGQLIVELDQPISLRTVIEARGGTAGAPQSASSQGHESDGVLTSLPAASRLKRYYADHLSFHEPMYFVFGGEKPAAKFQVSLKYRVLNDAGPLATRFPALKGVNVGYTQRSLWDITDKSGPFFDTSYMPELFYESLAPDPDKPGRVTWIGYNAGVQHESNGRDGVQSRGVNSIYFRPTIVLGDPNGWRIIVRPKFFAYIGSLSDNPDIEDYRGYAELRVIVGQNNRLSLSLTGRIGQHFDKGSAQVDVTYPTEFLTGNFALYLHAQYWVGYGESLLRYNQRTETVRAGVSIAR